MLLKENIENSGIFEKDNISQAIKENTQELGKSILETLYIWASSKEKTIGLVKEIHGQEFIDKAEDKGKGIIFLTPHLGCFEIASIFYGATNPITIMYRKARKKWMSDLMINGRNKGLVNLASADSTGLKKILIALKNSEAVGILPDQVADKGKGEMADFFGRPAYTMVLTNKLIEKTEASIIMVYGERLKNGRGFDIHCKLINRENILTSLDLNKALESFIRKNPTQYYWSYDRFKKIKNK
jgi:KDO2-lipid IV(A) lauroyltransferase